MADETLLPVNDKAAFEIPAQRRQGLWKSLLFAISLVLNAIFFFRLAVQKDLMKNVAQLPADWAQVEPLPLKWVRFKWNTPWGSNNDTEADVLWDNILTSHGHLAVNHKWAEQHNWPETMSIPKDESKGLYLLESYHQLHCLRIVRKTLLESVHNRPLTYPVKHSRHCMDTLRQYIQCHADNTPLYTFGDHTSGDGQLHKCKDWGALRDFATENTACFRDMKPGSTLEEHFGYCDNGSDGIIGL